MHKKNIMATKNIFWNIHGPKWYVFTSSKWVSIKQTKSKTFGPCGPNIKLHRATFGPRTFRCAYLLYSITLTILFISHIKLECHMGGWVRKATDNINCDYTKRLSLFMYSQIESIACFTPSAFHL